uniref:Uncharacterized protein n=1 Tax=Ditylenchus dipsaci TaxID=166011 RepID=A0A915D467_9BILA
MMSFKPSLLCRLPSSSVLLCCAQRSLASSSIYDSVKQKLKKYSSEELVNASPKVFQPYLRLMRVDKPIGTWLLYWPCTWSIALATPAGCLPSFYLLGLFGAGALCMRSAGCVINDLWDRDFDKRVLRTKLRPLASGELSERQAIGLLAVLLSVSLSILLQLNWLSVFVGASSIGVRLHIQLGHSSWLHGLVFIGQWSMIPSTLTRINLTTNLLV